MFPVPAISIQNLVKVYSGSVTALHGISLDIPAGSFFGLLGANGAGKTTTIQILTGLCNPTSGQVSILGSDLRTEYLSCRKKIGVAPQEFNLDRFFSIQNILEFQGGYFGLVPKQAKAKAQELLVRFDLWEKRNVKPPMLSGGMKRRLLLMKALMHDPDILIRDEPTAGMDVELRHEFWNFLKEWNALGKTILLTTHYLEEAEKLCTEIAVLHQGRILKHASTKDMVAGHHNLEEAYLRMTA